MIPKDVDIFVVVEESCLRSWLSSVKSFGDGAAVIVGITTVTENDTK